MNHIRWNTLLSASLSVGTAAAVFLGMGGAAQAGTLHNGWNYSIDSFNDGTEGRVIGQNSDFEFYGMAVKDTADAVYFAFNSNLSLAGWNTSGARNNNISYGDLFLNFSNLSSFNAANGSLYGIRFAATNDSGVGLGLYQNVTATSVATANQGYSTLNSHTNTVSQYGGHASYGDLAANTSYFNRQQSAYTTIASGEYLGDISFVDGLDELGLDFANFGATGTYTFGFSVDKSLLSSGDFIASLFAECGNDGVALTGELADVPEPSALLGLLSVGAIAAGARLRKRLNDLEDAGGAIS